MKIFEYVNKHLPFDFSLMMVDDLLTGIETSHSSKFYNTRFWIRKTNVGLTLIMTDDINEWMLKNNITYPFTDDERVLFELTWG